MKRYPIGLFVLLAQILVAGVSLASPSAKSTFTVKGMTCGGCVGAVKMRLKRTAGVESYAVSFEKGEAEVTYDPAKIDPPRIAEAISKTGYPASVKTEAPAPAGGSPAAPASNDAIREPKLSSVSRADTPAERLTFYEVGLACPAAPKIGCGGKAKPALRALAADENVAGAWLNEAGTRIAVAWKNRPLPKKNLDEILGDHSLTIHEVRTKARTKLVESFHETDGWYDAAIVDRLSEREAGIIAARFVRRLKAKTKLTSDQEKNLKDGFEQTIRRAFTSDAGVDIEDVGKELVSVSEKYLSAVDVALARKVITRGYRPQANEE